MTIIITKLHTCFKVCLRPIFQANIFNENCWHVNFTTFFIFAFTEEVFFKKTSFFEEYLLNDLNGYIKINCINKISKYISIKLVF